MDIDVGELGPLQPVYVTFIFILSYHGSMGIFSLSFSARICMCSLCAAQDCIYVMQMLLYVTVATFARLANPSVFKQKKGDMSLNPTRDKHAHLFPLCVIYRRQLAINRTSLQGPNHISTKDLYSFIYLSCPRHLTIREL